MYALKYLINGETFKTTFDKSSLPVPIYFQNSTSICGEIMVNPNNEREINIGGFGKDRGYAIADGRLDFDVIHENVVLEEKSINIEIVPYETDGDELDGGVQDVYPLINTGTLPKVIHSCAFFVFP